MNKGQIAGAVLRANERSALTSDSGEIISRVKGKKLKGKGKLKSFSAASFITAIIVVFLAVFSSGNLIPSAISERLIEEMDVQYADAVESKKLVFQQALYSGSVPEDTAELLASKGVLVGYIADGAFVEANSTNGELVLKMGEEIITADQFISKVSSDAKLYDAFNTATYSRAAYYYDESAKKVFEKIGTNRNNYTSESDFDEVMAKKVGEGSNMDIEAEALVKKTREKEDGTVEEYYEYATVGTANSKGTAEALVSGVAAQNKAGSSAEATMNAADELKVADTVAKEQKSSLFFLTFMENISKMKAGEGSESKINEAMNYLYNAEETEVVDVRTGEIVKTTGTALESPSLYAVLAGSKVRAEAVENYSSDRILKTAENQLGLAVATSSSVNSTTRGAISGTVASTGSNFKSAIGRLIANGVSAANEAVLDLVTPTVSKSLVDNSYTTIKGVSAGEMLVEGAINVGKELAKASGATAGDASATVAYLKLQNETLAMDAKVDRMNRSPFDITSKNTFLGSIIYNLAVLSSKTSGILAGVKQMSAMVSNGMRGILGIVSADEGEGYLASFGDCATLGTVGAVGSAQCSTIETFDTSTLNNTFSDSGFVAFVEANTTLDASGTRRIKDGSDLAKFISYNNERDTPVGVMDGGILNSLATGSSSNSFFGNILSMIKTFLGSSEGDKRIASGAAFVNTSSNSDWQTYKYAQRYVSLARATEVLKQYTKNKTAYNNIKFFEGEENPVLAYLNRFNASDDNLVVAEVLDQALASDGV